ncbi:MAG: DUF4328 domain-containing protein [Nocardioidaceae bacterium]
MSYYQDPVPPHSNPYAGYPYQDSRAPRGLAVASAILAGVVTLVQIGSGLTAPSAADTFAEAAREGRPAFDVFTAYDAVTILYLPSLLAAYIVTCLWLSRSRTLLGERFSGYPHARSKVWVWLGWWVPIVNLWFPYQVVRDIRLGSIAGRADSGILAGWWACWLIFLVGTRASGRMTGDTQASDPSTFDALPWIEGVNTVAAVIGFACWLGIIRQITRGQEARLAAPSGSDPTRP